MKELKHFDRIHAYFEQEMDKSQRLTFETELRHNTLLQKEYDAFMAAQKAMDSLAFDALGDLMNKEVDIPAKPIWKMAWAQAAIGILLLGVLLFLYSNQRYSNQALVNRYAFKPNLNIERASSEVTLLMQSSDAFEEENFEEAIAFAKRIPADSKDYPYAQRILGHAYLRNQQSADALSAFEKVQLPLYGNEIKWHQALALLQNGQLVNGKKQLQGMLQQSSPTYQGKAQQLLNDLDSFLRKLTP